MLPYFVAWLCVPILSIPFFMHVFRFRFTDIHAFTWSQIYCLFSYITSFSVPACLDHITWSCTRVPVMHAIWLYNMYSLGLLTTLDSHVQILESGPWWLGCSWSERAADPPVVIRVQQKLGHRCSPSSQLFSCLAPEVPLAVSWASLSFIMYAPSCIVLLYFLVM